METKKATEKINETKSWFFEKIKLTNLQLESPKKKKGLKYIESEMKELQLIPQKYKEA